MRRFRNIIACLNGKYDSLPDSKRLGILVSLVIPSILLVHGTRSALAILLGFLWLGFLFSARMAWLGRARRA